MATAAIVLLVGWIAWGNTALELNTYTIHSHKLPASFSGLRIAHVSDLHNTEIGDGNEKLLSMLQDAEPDLIAITGDLIDSRRTDINIAVDFAEKATKIAPCYYVTGNHEWASGNVPSLKKTLADAGWTVLSNQYLQLNRNESSLILAGIDDPNGYADQKTPEELTAELYAACGDPFWILLAHRNDRFVGQYCLLGADLVVSGHGHGGVIRVPFTDGLLGTQHTLFPTHTAGLYEKNASALFVSRGLGNVGITFRLFNRPEVAILTLHKG